jgi:NAD-dependent SIR2 family protein deacetylase
MIDAAHPGARSAAAPDAFIEELSSALPALVLSGAGISAGTGIPTYRDENGVWLRSEPIRHQEFLRDPRQRQRYWGRSQLGWPAVRDARPAAAHRHLVALEARGTVSHVVTQNVDRLHQRAGSQRVTDLHGRLDRVVCLDCGDTSCREQVQGRLEALNPGHRAPAVEVRPDGDADLPDRIVDGIRVPDCQHCGGRLMPDVVFFGGSVPAERVAASREALLGSRSLLVIGSSLQVYSGFRFCRWAAQARLPIFIVNPGLTRADAMARKWSTDADSALATLLERLY